MTPEEKEAEYNAAVHKMLYGPRDPEPVKEEEKEEIIAPPEKYDGRSVPGLFDPEYPYQYINRRDENGLMPLHYAALWKNAMGMIMLIRTGADNCALTSNGANALSLILANKPIPEAPDDYTKMSPQHTIETMESLLLRSPQQQYFLINGLLADWADQTDTVKPNKNEAPIVKAVELGSMDIIKYLIIDCRAIITPTAIQRTKELNKTEILQFLEEHKK
jgi:hypothetical protein